MKIFCSGIGGIGLSAYAAYQRAAGHEVSGSDQEEGIVTADLQAQGISVSFRQDGSAIPPDTDLFVYTLALPEGHPELQRAKELVIRQQSYFEALGDLTCGSELIAVCGTHGKSSTTAMAAKVLIEAGQDPSVILGTRMKDLGDRNWRRGTSSLFLAEACEYRRSFLHLSPRVILLTNTDGDHFDAFKDMEDYRDAFRAFIGKLPPGGVLILHGSDRSTGEFRKIAEQGDVRVTDADQLPLPELQIPGKHMRENARLVLALAEVLHLDRSRTDISLRNYAGSWRRMEIRGETRGGVLVIDDYGHHPTEIKATLRALREAYPTRRLVCVFQPHTHDRTIKLYPDFLGAFSDAALVIIPNIYDARPHTEERSMQVPALVSDIARESHVEACDGKSLEGTIALLRTNILRKGDLLVTMGAGDVWRIANSQPLIMSLEQP